MDVEDGASGRPARNRCIARAGRQDGTAGPGIAGRHPQLLHPAFRIKHDVVPGQYEAVWFKATEPGTYQIECSEFCGTEHAHMKGEVVVMEPVAFARWLRDEGVHESLA